MLDLEPGMFAKPQQLQRKKLLRQWKCRQRTAGR